MGLLLKYCHEEEAVHSTLGHDSSSSQNGSAILHVSDQVTTQMIHVDIQLNNRFYHIFISVTHFETQSHLCSGSTILAGTNSFF